MRRAKRVAVQHVMAMKSSAAAKALARYKIRSPAHPPTHPNPGLAPEPAPGRARHQAGRPQIMSRSKSQMPIVVLEAIGLLVSTVVQTPPRRTPEAPGAAGPTPADQFHPNANAPILPGRTCLERVGLNRYSGWQPTDCQQKGGDGA